MDDCVAPALREKVVKGVQVITLVELYWRRNLASHPPNTGAVVLRGGVWYGSSVAAADRASGCLAAVGALLWPLVLLEWARATRSRRTRIIARVHFDARAVRCVVVFSSSCHLTRCCL